MRPAFQTPLHTAAAAYFDAARNIAELLAAGAAVDAIDAESRTALHVAMVHEQDPSVISMLTGNRQVLPHDSL